MNWCEQLNDKGEINDNVLTAQKSVIEMTEQMRYYERLMEVLSNIIDNLQIENKELHKEVFASKFI